MPDGAQIAAFSAASLLLGANAFDTALHVQVATKDDATMALWTGVGLEVVTLAAVIYKAPEQAFIDDRVPSAAALQAAA